MNCRNLELRFRFPERKDPNLNEEMGPVGKYIPDVGRKREELKQQRNRLFTLFLRNPEKIQLAAEIKRIDDIVAEYTEKIRQH